ncbi:MAG: hypothetical protein OCU16_02345 [Candidatus Methanospirare jalkutatii]|nr:hypothetical protein [Candidatus Methanospirare jalkutatii]
MQVYERFKGEIESIVKEFLKTLDRDFHLAVAVGQMNLKVEIY